MAAIYRPPPPEPVPVPEPETPTKAPVTPKKTVHRAVEADSVDSTPETVHSLTLRESAVTLQALAKKDYSFGLAKSVRYNDQVTSNTLFLTRDPQATTTVAWTESYALNYTFLSPSPGRPIIGISDWNACKPGEKYTLNQNGLWAYEGTGDNADSMTVNNQYQKAVIIIGVKEQNSTGYVPIWFTSTQLPQGSLGIFKPTETVEMWFAAEQKAGTVLVEKGSDQKTASQTIDYKDVYAKFARYSSDTNSWEVNDEGFSSASTRPLPPGYWRKIVEFTLPVHDQAKFVTHLRTHLHDRDWQAYVTVAIANKTYTIVASDIEGSHDPAGQDNLESDLYAVLEELLVEKILPRNEEWIVD